MVNFVLPDRKLIPEVDEIPINPYRLKQIIEDCESYNVDSRLWRKYESDTGEEIPERYRGRNRYWAAAGESTNEKIGAYPMISIYDLDPSEPEGKVLIAKYRPERSSQKNTEGEELEATPLQTLAQAEKHLRACKLEAERQERMAKKDPKLTTPVKVHIPILYSPNAARKVIDARENSVQY